LLTSTGSSGPLDYDPLMRFYRNYTTYFIHDTGSASGAGGGQLIGDYYDGSIANRYVPGPGVDEPLVSVGKTGARTWFHADERGSIIAGSDGAGANARIILYDENGKRGSGGSYRFAFTGQVHLINDIYDYKSRNYNARWSRFLQTDRIGYGGGMNPYVYVGGDPVNLVDPNGMCAEIVAAHGGDCPERKELVKYLESLGYSTAGLSAEGLLALADWVIAQAAMASFEQIMARLNAMQTDTAGFKLASAQSQTYIKSLPVDNLGFHHLNQGTIGHSLLSPTITADVHGLDAVRLITRFTGPVACGNAQRPCGALNQVAGAYGAQFRDFEGNLLARHTIIGAIGAPFSRVLSVPAGSTIIRIYPFIQTPAGTQIVVRGRW